MANNFSIFYDPTSTDSTELPLFKEYLIDYENQGKQPIYNGREITILTGNDAVKIWIYRALKTERLTYAIHSDSYGNDLKEHIGTVYNKTIKQALIQQEIKDCLLVNPYITNVYDFSFSYNETDRAPRVSFMVDTVYQTQNQQGVELLGI